MHRWEKIVLFAGISLAVAGCPKGRTNFNQGQKAQNLQDYDAAYEYYQKALKSEPENTEYKIKFDQARFGAGEAHTKKGLKLREQGDLENAASEFRRAAVMDPSSVAAEQELRKTVEMIDDRERAANAASEPPPDNDEAELASAPPQLKPLSRAPINLKMSNDAKVVFDTIGKLAGLTVIYDPDFPARRISVELNDVTLEQALDIVCIESKAFSMPISENIILVIPDQVQKRRDYEEEFMRTFYLSNTAQAQDLTEIVTGLRQLLDLKRIQQLNAQNAIVIRATPDQLALAEKFIKDIDKAKSEVIIQVEVLEARTDRMRDLGILPGQSASIAINPNSTTNNNTNTSGSSTTTNTTPGTVTLSQLTHLNQNDLVLTLPSATANFLLTDSTTRVIQNPEVRSLEGQPAKLNIGDRVPVATGSFQAGVGVGATGGAGFVNPLVNTQFQYIDVGVNVEVTPRVHPNRDVSLKLQVEVSSVSNNVTIGGIQQPVISQRKIAHEIRLKEGESSMLAGLITKSDMKTLNGWPGLAHIPILKHLFSDDNRSSDDDEILMILTPRIVRMPEWTKSNLKALYAGSETNVQTKRASEMRAPQRQPPAASPSTKVQEPAVPADAQAPSNSEQSGKPAEIRFEPRNLSLKAGQTMTVGVVVDNVNDLFSIPFLLQYNPALISVEEVRHGGFLQAGDQEIAIVQKVDNERGQAIISATRQPNTAGVSGTGTILGIVIKGLAPGTGTLSIVQVSAKDSQQRPIQLVTNEASVQVKP
ncbi:MAG TPA: cohesin domain-containing protein [Candidatus Baltobacteraceae bacterium]|nr:cohesin domain-containing protein [Candidatus Baltobacteraceae bacterium]